MNGGIRMSKHYIPDNRNLTVWTVLHADTNEVAGVVVAPGPKEAAELATLYRMEESDGGPVKDQYLVLRGAMACLLKGDKPDRRQRAMLDIYSNGFSATTWKATKEGENPTHGPRMIACYGGTELEVVEPDVKEHPAAARPQS